MYLNPFTIGNLGGGGLYRLWKKIFSVIESQELPISTKKEASPTINVVNLHSHARVDISTIVNISIGYGQ